MVAIEHTRADPLGEAGSRAGPGFVEPHESSLSGAETVSGTSPPTILLVDDDPRNLFALESVLEGGNYAIAKAQGGNEALLALMAQEFAAIVLDVQMPEVNGIELARLIK